MTRRWSVGWVGAGLLEAERSFHRIQGYKHMDKLVAAVRKEVAQRLAKERDDITATRGTPDNYDQAVA